VATADSDATLNADARRLMVDARTSQDVEIEHATLRAAKKDAFEDAERALTQSPHVWHKGRDRARAMLGVVRAEIPANRRGAFPADVARLISEAMPEKVRDLTVAIPDEVQRLLELMVEP